MPQLRFFFEKKASPSLLSFATLSLAPKNYWRSESLRLQTLLIFAFTLFLSHIALSEEIPPAKRADKQTPSDSSTAGLILEAKESHEIHSIQGKVYEKGTRKPLAGISVYILPQKLKAQTNARGEFAISISASGEIQWVVNSPGYKKYENLDTLSADKNAFNKIIYLEKESYTTFESTTVGKFEKRDESKKTLRQEDFLTLPGAGGDPVKAVQNLPGINRPSGFSSNVIIQGSAPQDTKYNIDDHEIPLVFHFGGLTSVIMPEAVKEVEYFSAGYGAEYSRALGGVISLQTREAELDGRDSKGIFFVDTLKSGVLYETNIDDSSKILVSGRYSYVGLVLKQALKDNKDVNLTAAPDFADFSTIYSKNFNKDEKLKITALYSRDTLQFVFTEPFQEDPSLRGNFKNETVFWRFIPQYTLKINESTQTKFSLGLGQDKIIVDVGSNYFDLQSLALTTRGEYEKREHEKWTWQLGFDNAYSATAVKLRLPTPSGSGGVRNPISSSSIKSLDTSGHTSSLGLYWRNEIKSEESLSWVPALRWDRFSSTKENLLSPRFAIRKNWSDSLLLKTSTGLYYQTPRPQEIAENFGNPDLKSIRALHATVGFEKDFRAQALDGWQWNSGLFYRDFTNVVISSSQLIERNGESVAEVYSNRGTGKAQGLETQIKFNRGAWKGWLSYTLSESRRSDDSHSNYAFEFDQTHNINIVGAYDYGNNWQLSGRIRYVTGNPYTPVSGAVFDADNDVYLPLRGDFFSNRRAAFTQLDFRADKKFIYDTRIWSFYVDIQNVLNAKNAEDLRYSYDYSQEENVMGLPFLPALGLKGEF